MSNFSEDRTDFETPPLTPIEEVENLLRGIEDTLRMANKIMRENKNVDFSCVHGEIECIQDAMIDCKISSVRLRKSKGAA